MAVFGHRSFFRFLLDGFVGIPRSVTRFITLQFCVMLSAVLAYVLWTWFDKPSGVLGLGVPMVVGSLFVFAALWAFQLGHILLFYPFPSCRNGTCRSIDDYFWHVPTIYGRMMWGVYLYRCRCGNHYVRCGKKFMEILPNAPRINGAIWKRPILADQTTRPYKKLTGFRRWSDDFDVHG